MADLPLPSGTVTFLFTDIEDSTVLWERDPSAMGGAVERHLAMLRETVAAHGGVLFKTIGDGTQSAFATAGDALAAALTAQLALRAEAWPDPPGPLRVRMGLHAGEATPEDGDYLAAPLNRLARLLGIARGGQILLTEAVRLLGRDDLPPQTHVRDLGEIALRDLEREEHAFALIHPALPDTAALPERGGEPRRNFPSALTPFVGRAAALEEITALLREPGMRLLTLTGPGGIGKTRLAVEAGTRLADAFDDGAVFVDLAAVSDADHVLPAIAVALGLREMAGRPIANVLDEELRERHLLLLLDNFEHVLDAAPRVADLLAAAVRTTILATSRAPLRIRGEQVYPVPALRLPPPDAGSGLDALAANEAVAFFVARAQTVRRGFALTAELAPIIAAICTRLDGLPLAIELAAARLRLLTPQALLTRLEQRLPLLTGGPRDAPARQQTLRDAIAWSFDLLGAEERALFARLGIFAGGFSLDAVEGVLGREAGGGRREDEENLRASFPAVSSASRLPPPASVIDGLAALVDASLVLRDESGAEPRFGMLETIREFARERLAEDAEGLRAAAAAHAAYFLQVVEEADDALVGPRQGVWLARLDADTANLRAALTWITEESQADEALRFAGALWRYWLSRGQLGEGRGWLERTLALPGVERATAAAQADAHNALGNILGDSGDYMAARHHLELALELRRTLADPLGIAAALNNLGIVALWLGDCDGARALHEESLTIRQAENDRFGMSLSLSNLGDVALAQGAFARAREFQEQSLRLREARQDASGSAYAIYNLGEIARLEGDVAQAVRRLTESQQRFAALGDRIGAAYAEWSLGDLASRGGDHARAAELFGRVLETRTAIGDKRGAIETLEAVGLAAIRAGFDADGLRLLGAAECQRGELASPLSPAIRADHERDVAMARTRLEETAIETFLEEGQLLSTEQALALARDVIAQLARVQGVESPAPRIA